MDYEKKYKALIEAIKILKEANPSDEGIQDWVNDSVPELQKSEDEIMWKLIKKYAHCNISDMALAADHITREQLESWLEKQGEQKTTNKVVIKKAEKPIAWSEEDKKMFVNIKACLRNANKDYSREIEWLKSIKPPYGLRQECVDCQFNYAGECKGSCAMKRDEQNPAEDDERLNHWKPTEEQMNSLAYIITHPNEGNKSDYAMLHSLYKDLQRLK